MAMAEAELLTVYEDKIEVEYSQFMVKDEGLAWVENPDVPSPEPPLGLDDLVTAGTDWICIGSGAQDHTASARLEAWSGEPQRQDGWELTEDFNFTCTTGRLFLDTLTMGPASVEDRLTLGSPGRYRGRAYSRGRWEARDASASDEVPEGTEKHLIQFWPA